MIAYSQAQSYTRRHFVVAATAFPMESIESDSAMIQQLVEWSGHRPTQIARKIGMANTTINRHFNGTATTRLSLKTIKALAAAYPSFPLFNTYGNNSVETTTSDYVLIRVLPSYAGMGGGGTGEGDQQLARLPRRLIVEELRGSANDFELIDVRGDSMEPDFQHGDQILIDRRDCDPRQPGPFALFDGDGYVVKLVERIPQKKGWYRVFSANDRYQPYEVEAENVSIMGRPVWFARKL